MVKEIYQFSPTTFEGSIVFPKLIMSALYRRDILIRLEMTMLDSMELNEPFPHDTFKLQAKGGLIVMVENSGEESAFRLQVDCDDVAAAVREHEEQQAVVAEK